MLNNDHLVQAIRNASVIELLQKLVRTPSYIGLPRQEERVVQELASYLEAHKISVQLSEVRPGRPNLLAHVAGKTAGRHLLLCGHTDTVPPNRGAERDLLSAEIREGRMYGRGTVDMKGAIAAMAAALVVLQQQHLLKQGKVTLAAVIDEEMESLGAEALIHSGFKADGAIVGEPTSNRIAIGHKGLEWLEIEFRGKATHGGTPERGINAISAASRFVVLVEEKLKPQLRQRAHPVIGAPTINMGTIHGGDQPSTVAANCKIQLDRRWVPAENVELVFSELEDLLAEVRHAMPGLQTLITRVPGGMATMVHGPLETAADHPLVTAASQSRGELFGEAGGLTAFPAWTDAALLSREAGIPSIVLGPGDLSLAHSPEESIELAEVEAAARLYVQTARCYLSDIEPRV